MPHFNLQDAKKIRVIVPDAPNMGLQTASMDGIIELRNRFLFNGEIEILYRTVDVSGRQNRENDKKMEKLIPGFNSSELDDKNQIVAINSPLYGSISVGRIDEKFNFDALQPVELCMSFANDNAVKPEILSTNPLATAEERKAFLNFQFRQYYITEGRNEAEAKGELDFDSYEGYHQVNLNKQFKADKIIVLQPTDYRGYSFVRDETGEVTMLPENLRIPQHLGIDTDIENIELSSAEKNILEEIAKPNIESQLAYDINKMYGDRFIGGCNIIRAHLKILNEDPLKTHVLIMPNAIEPHEEENYDFTTRTTTITNTSIEKTLKESLSEEDLKKVVFVDLQKDKLDLKANKGKIVVCTTGFLKPEIFNALVTKKTTMPPVLQGVRNVALLESTGKPFIKISPQSHLKISESLQLYDVEQKEMQDLHKSVEKALCTDGSDIIPVVEYIELARKKDGILMNYHEQRKERYLERPNAIEYALEKSGIEYQNTKSQQNISNIASVAALPLDSVIDHKVDNGNSDRHQVHVTQDRTNLAKTQPKNIAKDIRDRVRQRRESSIHKHLENIKKGKSGMYF